MQNLCLSCSQDLHDGGLPVLAHHMPQKASSSTAWICQIFSTQRLRYAGIKGLRGLSEVKRSDNLFQAGIPENTIHDSKPPYIYTILNSS